MPQKESLAELKLSLRLYTLQLFNARSEDMTPAFAELIPEWGVDAQATPRAWIMVPLEDHNLILLKDGIGWTLKPIKGSGEVEVSEIKNAVSRGTRRMTRLFQTLACSEVGNAAKVCRQLAKANMKITIDAALFLAHSSNARLFALFGKRQGLAQVVAEDTRGKTKPVVLDVSIKKERTYTVAFNFVNHQPKGSSKPVSHTAKDFDSTEAWMRALNQVLSPQINVRFTKHLNRWVTAETDLGKTVTPDKFKDYLVEKRHRDFDFNIFIAGDVWSEGTDSAFYMPTYASAAVQDAGGPRDQALNPKGAPALSIAHEAGHFLHGAWASGHPKGGADTLMSGQGVKIPKDHVDFMNPYSG
jgi:hypothetical protein